MSKVHNIDLYQVSSTDVFFFDNNVWMFLFCPIASAKGQQQRKYSALFSKICTAGACVWINALVLSEFCNAWLRIEYNEWKKKPENFGKADYKRNYVGSNEYQLVVQDIKKTVPMILKKTERCSDNFNAINLSEVYSQFGECDFNDSYYLELAHMNKWKIVTDDADLYKQNTLNVEIITANIR